MERRNKNRELWHQTKSNHQGLTKLTIKAGSFLPRVGYWKSFGEMIGRNTHIKELTLSLPKTLGLGSLLGSVTGPVSDSELIDFFRGLSSNRSVEKMYLRSDRDSFYNGDFFTALMPFFKNNNYLIALDISGLFMSGEAATILATSLDGKDLELTLSGVLISTDAGWQAIFRATKGRSTVKLDLGSLNERQSLTGSILAGLGRWQVITMRIAVERALAGAWVKGNTIKTLNLANCIMSLEGRQKLFAALRSPHCRLEELVLCNCGLNNDDAISLSSALSGNHTIKTLNLACNRNITHLGWRPVLDSLQRQHSAVESLDLSESRIDDETADSIARALVNGSLQKMDLSSSQGRITGAGWQAFAVILQNPRVMLETLNLRFISDAPSDIARYIAEALANNNQMKELTISPIMEMGAFLPALCNTASIMSTFNSNHTLERLRGGQYGQNTPPANVMSLLHINGDNGRYAAARLKIIHTHFCGTNIGTQPFMVMELGVLPQAVAWAGKDVSGRSLMYQLIRSLPFMFERVQGKNKRTRFMYEGRQGGQDTE